MYGNGEVKRTIMYNYYVIIKPLKNKLKIEQTKI